MQGANALFYFLLYFNFKSIIIGRTINRRKYVETCLIENDGHFFTAFLEVTGGPGQINIWSLAIDHPSEIDLMVRLLLYSGLGMAAGPVAEARKAGQGRDAS